MQGESFSPFLESMLSAKFFYLFVFPFLLLTPTLINPYKTCCCWTLLESQGEPVQVPDVRVVQALLLCMLYLLQGAVLLPRALGFLGREHSLRFPSVIFK